MIVWSSNCHSVNPVVQLEEVALVYEKGGTRRRGFVFVTFKSEDSVDRTCENDFHTVDGSKVAVSVCLSVFVYCFILLFPKVEVKKAVPKDSVGQNVSKHGSYQSAGRGFGHYDYHMSPQYFQPYPQPYYPCKSWHCVYFLPC